MEYKVGDLVKLKKTLVVDKKYGNDFFIEEMLEYKNKILRVENITGENITLSIKDVKIGYVFTKEMLSDKLYNTKETSEDEKKFDYDGIYDINEISKNSIIKINISTREIKEEIVNYVNSSQKHGTIALRKKDFKHDLANSTLNGYGWYIEEHEIIGLANLKQIFLKENISVFEICDKEIGKLLKIEGWTSKYYLEKPVEKEHEYYLVEEIENENITYSVILNETLKGIFVINKIVLEQYLTTKEENRKVVETAQTQLDLGVLANEVKELTKEIKQREPFQKAITEAIIEKGKEIATKDLEDRLKNNLDDYIERKYGILPKQIVIQTEESTKELQGIFHKEFENICKIVKKDIPLMLVGPAGAGKNHTLEQVAEALDLMFYSTGSISQEYKLTGFIDAGGKYHETEFYKAFTNGGLFFLDEIDASSPEVLVQLNGAIANGYFEFPTGRVNKHKDFRVVCAGNTFGTGADMIYVGRNVLDGATLDRFVVLDFDYDEEVEKQLAYNEEILEFIRDLRKAVNNSSLRYIVGMRALINASKMLEIGFDKKTILKSAVIKNMQIDDLNTVVGKINTSSEWGKELKGMTDLC